MSDQIPRKAWEQMRERMKRLALKLSDRAEASKMAAARQEAYFAANEVFALAEMFDCLVDPEPAQRPTNEGGKP